MTALASRETMLASDNAVSRCSTVPPIGSRKNRHLGPCGGSQLVGMSRAMFGHDGVQAARPESCLTICPLMQKLH